jgi:fructokinase
MNKITAIGEILFDIYPGSKKMGGAPLNFLYHIYKFTGAGNIISRIGNDTLGEEILQFLKRSNISSHYVQIDQKYPTGIAAVDLNEKNEPSFIIESNRAYDFIETNNNLHKLIEESTDCLYFGSLAQRYEVTRNTIHSLMGKNIKYFCDLNIRQNFYNEEIIIKSLSAADILKVNIDEIKLLNDLLIKENFDLEKSSAKLINKFDIKLLAVTKGAEGSILIKDKIIDEFKVDPFEAIDTVGAGDAFAAVLCIGYLNGWELPFTNKFANRFASEICRITGALPGDEKIYNKLRGEFEYETGWR